MATHGGVIDSGISFEIVPNTRKIIVPQMYKVIGTVGEQNSEKVTFRCPKLVDGHEISACSRKYVTWKNTQGEVGHNELNQVRMDDEYVYFTWLIPEGLTVEKGFVSFSVHFEDVDSNGVVQYRFGTTACTECEILDAINGTLGKYKAMRVVGDTLVIKDYTPVENDSLSLGSVGIVPNGTKTIEENGLHDVSEYAQVRVEVGVDQPLEQPTIYVEKGIVTAIANGLTQTKRLEKPVITKQNKQLTANANGLVSEPYELDKPYITQSMVQGKNTLKAYANGLESDLYALDTPTFTLESGKIIARANGNSAMYDLEKPTIDVDSNGKITASANGLTTEHLLAEPFVFYSGTIKFNKYTESSAVLPSFEVYYMTKTSDGNVRANYELINAGEEKTRTILKDSYVIVKPLKAVKYAPIGGQDGCQNVTTIRLDSVTPAGGYYVSQVTGDDFKMVYGE